MHWLLEWYERHFGAHHHHHHHHHGHHRDYVVVWIPRTLSGFTLHSHVDIEI